MRKNALNKILKLLCKYDCNKSVPIPSAWFYPVNDLSGRIYKANLSKMLDRLIHDILTVPSIHKGDRRVAPTKPKPVIYGSFVRTTMAYDFDNDNRLKALDKFGLKETGTFLRMILLLPLLKKMGINILYLLPVTMPSRHAMKGSAPSPYSARDFFRLDRDLYDPLTGPFSDELLELQFTALVESAGRLGIRVILDFVPRTAARDNVLILEHPDWFYWIRKEEEKGFRPPKVEGIGGSHAFDRKYVKAIYSSPEVKEHLRKFSFSPDRVDPVKWEGLRKKILKDNISDFLPLIEESFGLTTVPGFSDVINDSQPAWNDVTFLRLYRDHPVHTKPFLELDQPPYVLFDVIKASRSPCRLPNKKLWDLVSGIIPRYIRKYGISGARIDMGHTLPAAFEKMIMRKAKQAGKDLFMVAEELDLRNAPKAAAAGYDCIIGDIWGREAGWKHGGISGLAGSELKKIALPVFASAETPDTPRAMTRQGGGDFHSFVAALNFVLPNGIPFINSGFELRELQPLNKGIDSANSRLDLLPKKDLNYGKLSFFDYTCLHWDGSHNDILEIIQKFSFLYSWIRTPRRIKMSAVKQDSRFIFAYEAQINSRKCVIIVNTNLYKAYQERITVPFQGNNKVLIHQVFRLNSDKPCNGAFKHVFCPEVRGKSLSFSIPKAGILLLEKSG
jgi:starch synthase (maltosyl-transferring)